MQSIKRMALRLDHRPLYIQAAERIEEIITQEKLSPGSRLPSEVGLAELLGVSRSTIREALRDLELRGRIKRTHGRGTIIAEPSSILYGLNVLESLESLTHRQGWHCGTKDVVIKPVPAPAVVADFFGVPSGTPCTYLVRTKTRDQQPFCFMESWLPVAIMSPLELKARFRGSLGELLQVSSDPHLNYAIAEVGATAADERRAVALGVATGSPLVVLVERFYQNPAHLICYSINSYVPASVRLEVVRRPPGQVQEQ
jgi:GntR family transcriptional regulator